MSEIIQLYTCYKGSSEEPRLCSYYIDYTGSNAIQVATKYLSIPENGSYLAYVQPPNGNPQWISAEQTLRAQGVSNGWIIVVISQDPTPQPAPVESNYNSHGSNYNSQGNNFNSYSNNNQSYVASSLPVSTFVANEATFVQQNQFANQSNNSSYNSMSSLSTPSAFSSFQLFNFDQAVASPLYQNSAIQPEPSQNSFSAPVYEAINYQTNDFSRVSESSPDSGDEDLDICIDSTILELSTNNGFGAVSTFDFEESDSTSKKDKRVKLEVFDSFKQKSKSAEFIPKHSFDEVLNLSLRLFGFNRDKRYCLLVLSSDDSDPKWFYESDQVLESFQVSNGMHIRIFERDRSIKVNSEFFGTRTMHLDIVQSVSYLLPQIAGNFNLTSYRCYGIASNDNGNLGRILNSDLSIPQQTENFREVHFLRVYFLFSFEDLNTIQDAKAAFKEAFKQASVSKIRLEGEMILEYAALALMAQSDKGHRTRSGLVPQDISEYLPKGINGNNLGSRLEDFIRSYGALDQFNAIRRFLRLVRRFPGFASDEIECQVSVKYHGAKETLDVIVNVSPLRLLIIDKQTKVIEERISYTEIVTNKTLGGTLELQFAGQRGKIEKYTFHARNVDIISNKIAKYQKISQDIVASHARKYSADTDFTKLITERYKLELFTTTSLNDQNPTAFLYDNKFTGFMLLKAAEKYLKLPHDKDYVVLIKLFSGAYRWIDPDDVLGTLSLQDKMTVYVLKNFPDCRITYPDGSTKTIKIDITKPIEELAPFLFSKIGQPNIYGYTLFSNEDPQHPRPLDTRFSIPEQCCIYDTLSFKRRFFVLSAEVIQNQYSAVTTLCDCRDYILSSNLVIEEEIALRLAVYAYYALHIHNPSDMKLIKKFPLQTMLPKCIKVSSKIEKRFMELVQEIPELTPLKAAKNYIKISREIPGFGAEKFTIIYTETSAPQPRVIKGASVLIGPLKFQILDEKEKDIYGPVGYRLIRDFQSLSRQMTIKFYNPKTKKMVIGEMKTKDIETVSMLFHYNISIIHQLIYANQLRERQKKEEISKKLKGGWADENGIIHGPMLDFWVGKSFEKIINFQSVWIDLQMKYEDLLPFLQNILKLDPKGSHSILVRILEQQFAYCKKGMSLGDLHPFRGSVIIVVDSNPIIKFHTTATEYTTAQIDVTLPVSEIVETIGKKLHISHSLGFTLFSMVEDRKHIPLDTRRSLPEQLPIYNELMFKRHYFIITRFDLDDMTNLKLTYNDVRALVLSGNVEMDFPIASELAYYSIHADRTLAPTAKDVPDDISSMIPKGMKIPGNGSKQVKEFFKVLVRNQKDGMTRYINLARSLPTFGTSKYSVNLIEESNGQYSKRACTLFIGPTRVFCQDDQLKTQLIEVPYKRYINVESTDDEILFKYSGENFKTAFLILDSEQSRLISYQIKAHIDITTKLLLMRVKLLEEGEDPNLSKDRLELNTSFGTQTNNTVRIIFDHRYNASQIIAAASKSLGLSPSGQYSVLLNLTDDEHRWVGPNDIIGTYFPCDDMRLQVFNTYMPISVKLENGKTSTMILNITKQILDLIPEISEKLFVDYWFGCTLYEDLPPNEPKPLDLLESIPEQVKEFSVFLFRRRFLVMTKADKRLPVVTKFVYPDVKKNILSGIPVFDERVAVELAIYSVYAESLSEDGQQVAVPSDVGSLLPKKLSAKQPLVDKVSEYIRANPPVSKQTSLTKYISNARNQLHFGCEILNGVLEDKGKDDQEVDHQPRDVGVSIGPFGFHLFEAGSKQDIEKLTYEYIVSFMLVINRVVMRVAQSNHIIRTFEIKSRYARKLFKLLRQYKALMELLKKREEIQDLKSNPELESLLNEKIEPSINLSLARRIDHPIPPMYKFGLNFVQKEVSMVSSYYLVIPYQDGLYTVLYRCLDQKFSWLHPEKILYSINPKPKGNLYLLKHYPSIQIMTSFGVVKSFEIDITKDVYEHVKKANQDLFLGIPIGFTLYEPKTDETYRPLNYKEPLPYQSSDYMVVLNQRRFFVFSLPMFDDPVTLQSIYRDVRNMFLADKIKMVEEKALELALTCLYAEAESPSKVLSMTGEMNESQLKPLLPPSMQITHQIIRKFRNIATNMPPMSMEEATVIFIGNMMMLPGFASEKYPAKVTNLSDNISKEAFIVLNPYRISIDSFDTHKTMFSIEYSNLFKYELTNQIITIKFQDSSARVNHMRIESNDFYREIYSYIIGIIDIYQMEEMQQCQILMNDPINVITEHLKLGTRDTQGQYRDDDDFLDISSLDVAHKFDDISSIDVGFVGDINFDQRDVNIGVTEILDPTTSLMTSFDDNKTSSEGNNNDDDISWRANSDALVLSRSSRLLDTLEQELNLDQDSLLSTDPNELFKQINLLNGQISQFAVEAPTYELRNQFEMIEHSLDQVRDTARVIVSNDMEISPYLMQIRTQLNTALSSIVPAKVQLEKSIQDYKVRYNDDMQSLSTEPLSKPGLPVLSRNLIAISEIQEDLSNSLLKHSKELGSINESPVLLINTLQKSSSAFTTLASSIAENQNASSIGVHLIPQLKECKAQLEDLDKVLISVKGQGFDLNDTIQLQEKLSSMISKAEQTINQNQIKASESKPRKYQIFYGNHKYLDEVVPVLDSSPSPITLISLPSELNQTIQSLTAQESKTSGIIKKNIKVLNQNPSNEIARIETQISIEKSHDLAQEALSHLIREEGSSPSITQLKDMIQSKIPVLEKQLYTVSTINITPINSSRINGDLSYLINRQESLITPEEFERLDSKAQQQINEMQSILKQTQYSLRNLHPQLEKNIVNGEAIQHVQDVLFNLHSKLPEIQQGITVVQQVTGDTSFPIVIERLSANIDNTLKEKTAGDDLTKCPYVMKFIHSQSELASLINAVNQSLEHSRVQGDPELLSRARHINELAQQLYLDQIEVRKSIRQHPYQTDTLVLAKETADESISAMREIQLMSKRIAEITQNMQMDQLISGLLQDYEEISSTIESSKLVSSFQKIPTLEEIQAAIQLSNHVLSVLSYIVSLPEVSSNPSLYQQFTSDYHKVSQYIQAFNQEASNPTRNFYDIVHEMFGFLKSLETKALTIASFASNSDATRYIPYVVGELNKVHENSLPSIQTIKLQLNETLPHLQKLQNTIKSISDQNIETQSNDVKSVLSTWNEMMNSTITNIQAHLKNSEYNLKQANSDKDILLELQNQISTIPMSMRKSLDPQLCEQLAESISDAAQFSITAVNSIRQIPSSKKIVIDLSKFPKIDSDIEIEDSIPVIKTQAIRVREVIDEVLSSPQLNERQHTKQILNNMKENLEALKLSSLTCTQNESSLVSVLNKSKEVLSDITSNAELIEPIIELPSFTKMVKSLNETASIVNRMVSIPHLNQVSSQQFSTLIIPKLNEFISIINEEDLNNAQIKNQAIIDKVRNLQAVVTSSVNIQELKPRKLQQFCDEVYSASSALLPLLYDCPEMEDLQDKTAEIYENCSKFTSLPIHKVLGSNALLIKKAPISSSAIESLTKTALEAISTDSQEIPADIIDNTLDNLNVICDHSDTVPSYLSQATSVIIPAIKNRDSRAIPDAIRIVISSEPDLLARSSLFADLSVKTAINTAKQIIALSNSLKYLQQQIESSPESYSQETNFYNQLLQSTIKNSDPGLLIQCQSLPATVINYQSLHNVCNHTCLLLDSIKDINQLKPISQPLQDMSHYLTMSLYQTDTAIVSLFYSLMDLLIVSIESVMSSISVMKLYSDVKPFVRHSLLLLKSKDRGQFIDYPQLQQLSNSYLQFKSQVYPSLESTLPESPDKLNIINVISNIQRISPIIEYWSNMYLESPSSIRNQISSSLYCIINDLQTIQNLSSEQKDLLNYCMLQPLSFGTSLQMLSSKSDVPQIEEITPQFVACTDSFVKTAKLFPSLSDNECKSQIQTFISQLQDLSTEIAMRMPVTPQSSSAPQKVRELNPEIYISSIADVECLAVAKTAASMLSKFKTRLSEISSISASPSQDSINRKNSHQLIERIQNHSVSSSILDPVLVINKLDNSVLASNVNTNIQQSSLIDTLILPVMNQTKLIQSSSYSLLLQRLNQLKQRQLCEYPDVLKLVPNSSSIQFSEDLVTNGIMSIQNQLEIMGNDDRLKEAFSRMNSEQILVQQMLLNHAIKQISFDTLRISDSVSSISNYRKQLFDSSVKERITDDLPIQLFTSFSVSSGITRGYAILDLIQHIQIIQQQIIANTPEMCKFVHTPEGQQLLRFQISSNQVLEIQQMVLQQLEIIDSIEQLNAYQKSLTPEQIIIQQRLLNTALQLLSTDYVTDLICNEKIEPTPIGIVKAINLQLQQINKERPETTRISSFTPTDTIMRAQDSYFDLLSRISLSQSLLSIQRVQSALSPEANSTAKCIDIHDGIDPSLLIRQIPYILPQIESITNPEQFSEILRQLPSSELCIQQPILMYLASMFISIPRSKLSPIQRFDSSIIYNQILDEIQDQQNQEIASKPSVLNSYATIQGFDPIETFSHHNAISASCSAIIDISNIIDTMRFNCSTIDNIAKNDKFDSIKLDYGPVDGIRSKFLQIMDLSKVAPSQIPQIIQSLSQQDQAIIYSILQYQISQFKDIDQIAKQVKERTLQSRIFDKSVLIQKEAKKSTSANVSIPTPQTIQTDLIQSYQALAESELAHDIVQLMKFRASIYPELEFTIRPPQLPKIVESMPLPKVQELQTSLYEQLQHIKYSPTKVEVLITKSTPEERLVEQALLQHFSVILNSPQYVAGASQGIQFIPQNIYDPSIIDQTAYINGVTIASRLFQYQGQILEAQKESLANIPLPSASDLQYTSKVCSEQFEKSRLRTQMLTLQHELVSKNPELVEVIDNINEKGATKLSFTPEEIQVHQGVMKSTLAFGLSPQSFAQIHHGKTPSDLLKELASVQSIIEISKPQSTIITTVSTSKPSQTLLDRPVIIQPIDIMPIKSMSYKPRSELQSITSLAQATSDILPILAHFSTLPANECKSIFLSENAVAIDILEDLISSNGTTEFNKISQLVEISPELTASVTKVLTDIKDNEIKSLLVKDPSDILKMVIQIQQASTDLDNPQNSKIYREMCISLLKNLKSIEAATTEVTHVTPSPVECFANIVNAIKSKDTDRLNTELINFEAMRIYQRAIGTSNEDVDIISPHIDQISPHIQHYYVCNTIPDESVMTYLNQLQQPIVQLIGKNTNNPFISINEISTSDQLVQLFDESKNSLESSTNKLIQSIGLKDQKSSTESITTIIKSVADAQAAMFRGFDINSCSSSLVYTDYLKLVNSTMNSLHQILDIGKTSAVSSTSIRRSTRSFNRMINSMMDMLEDRTTAQQTDNPKTELEKAKLAFIKEASNGLQAIITTVSTNAGSKIPETFKDIVVEQIPRIESMMNNLHSKAVGLQKINTDKSVSNDFENDLNRLFSSFQEFKSSISQDQPPDLYQITGELIKVSDSMASTMQTISKLTDVVQKVPDLENAEKLPHRFSMPSLPSNTIGIKIQDAAKSLYSSTDDYFNKQKTFFGVVAHPQATNAHLVASVFPLSQSMTSLITSILCFSTVSMNYSAQRQLTEKCSTLVNSFDSLLRSLRDRFLLRGDWDTSSVTITSSIASTMEKVYIIVKDTINQSEAEERERNVIVTRFMSCIQPIVTIISSLEEYQKYVDELPTSLNKEFCLSILSPCVGVSNAVNHILLYAKDHPDSISSIDDMINSYYSIPQTLSSLCGVIGNIGSGKVEQPELEVVSSMQNLSSSVNKFVGSFSTSRPDATKLVDVLSSISNACIQVAKTAEQTYQIKKQKEARLQAQKSGTAKGSSGTAPQTRSLPKGSLLKRLDLEAKVIRARLLLEKAEKKLTELN